MVLRSQRVQKVKAEAPHTNQTTSICSDQVVNMHTAMNATLILEFPIVEQMTFKHVVRVAQASSSSLLKLTHCPC